MVNNSKQILIYCAEFVPQNSGYVNAFTQLIENISRHGYVVHVVTPYPLPIGTLEYSFPNVIVHRYAPKLQIWFLGWLYSSHKMSSFFNELDEKFKFELVFIETGDDPMLVPFLANSILAKTVVRFHATSDTEYLLFSQNRQYRIKFYLWKYVSSKYVKYVAATTSFHLNFIQQYLGFNRNDIRYHKIVNAVAESISIHPQQSSIRKFITLGRMDNEGYLQKGYAVLLEALVMVKADFIESKAKYYIVGQGDNSEFLKLFIAKNELNFIEVISSLSNSDVKKLLQQTDIVVLPSIYEGLSMFALEAIANGNAVVFSNTGGLSDMVDGNGIFVTPKNVAELADALKFILYSPLLSDYKLQSQNLALARFSEQTQWLQIEQLLYQLNYSAS